MRLLADGRLTLCELEQRLLRSGKYTPDQIDQMLALVIEVREDLRRNPPSREPS
jgi:hypothetical protein